MGFSWNGIHTRSLGILAEVRNQPILPEPRLITEEIPGRDGFVDFSAYNPTGRANYRPRIWEYRCAFEERIKHNAGARINAITTLFKTYSGYLIDDECPGVSWSGIVTNRIDLANVAGLLFTFGIIIQTQPFGTITDSNTYKWGAF